MRGREYSQESFFSYVSAEDRIAKDHPLRPIRKMVNAALKDMSRMFTTLYSHMGRPSIPPEQLLRATIIQILYSVRSERMLLEQLDYNILFRWFVGLSMDDPVWDHSVFSKNRERLLNTEVSAAFFTAVRVQADQAGLLSDEHFSVDGTLLEACASMKSFRPQTDNADPPVAAGRNPEVDFRGQKHKNDTHRSTTDPDARLYRKGSGRESKLCYMGHILMENRNGLAVNGMVTQASGFAERQAANAMLASLPGTKRVTMAADKAYDADDFVTGLRSRNITAHIATKAKGSSLDRRTTRHAGYEISLRIRKRIEEIFGWLKTVGTMNKLKLRGQPKVAGIFTFALAAYNLIRMKNLGVAGVT